MNALAPLVARSLARVGGVFAGLLVLLVALQITLVVVARQQQDAQTFDLMARIAPTFIQRQFGSLLPLFLSFQGLVSFGFFHPVVMLTISLFGAFVATELAADVEGGHVDLLLSRPLARHWLVTRSVVVMMLAPIICVVVMLVANRGALALLAPPSAQIPPLASALLMAAHLVALAWTVGAMGLFAGALAHRRISALGPTVIAVVTFFLFDFLAAAWRPLATAAVVSPFHYYQGIAVLAGTTDSLRDFLVLGAMTTVATATAYWRFNVRDV